MKNSIDTSPKERSTNRRFTLPQSETARDRRRNTLIVSGLAVTALAAVIGVNSLSHDARIGGDTPVGTLDSDITAVLIEEGATIRSDPHVTDIDNSNILDQINLGDAESITVSTENGAFITEDENGTWIGISTNDIDRVDINIQDDRDGIVWINEQRASAITDSKE